MDRININEDTYIDINLLTKITNIISLNDVTYNSLTIDLVVRVICKGYYHIHKVVDELYYEELN